MAGEGYPGVVTTVSSSIVIYSLSRNFSAFHVSKKA